MYITYILQGMQASHACTYTVYIMVVFNHPGNGSGKEINKGIYP